MLLDAIVRGRLYQVRFLLDSGSVNVNVTDSNGHTPLIKAILLEDKMQRTRFKIVRLLLEHGAKVNVTENTGKTALMLAAIFGLQDITEIILRRCLMDLDLNACDDDGNTALIHAVYQGHHVITSMIITALKRFGLDVDKKNRYGVTAMLIATQYGQEDCARVLYLEGAASLTIRDPDNFMNATEWAMNNQLLNFLELVEKSKDEPGQLSLVNDYSRPGTPIEAPIPTGLGAPFITRSRPQTPNKVPQGLSLGASLMSRSRPQTPNEAPQGTSLGASLMPRSRPQTPKDIKIEAPQTTKQGAHFQTRSRPQTPQEVRKEATQTTRPGTFSTVKSRPMTPNDAIKRPMSRKKSARKVLTVPGVMNSIRNQMESPMIVLDNPRIPNQHSDKEEIIPTGIPGKQAKSELGLDTSRSLLSTGKKSGKSQLTKGRSEQSPSAKSEIQNLLYIYGAQNSFSYRKGYDPGSLPPSGMWPDPNAQSTDDSVDNINGLGEFDFFSESAMSFGRKSVLSNGMSRRMSIVGQNQNAGRRMSIIGQGNANCDRRTSIAGRKFMVNQMPPQKNMLDSLGRRDRRMSVTARTNVAERPSLRRINTHMTSPVLG